MNKNLSTINNEVYEKQLRCLLVGSSSSISDSLRIKFEENGYDVFLANRHNSLENFFEINYFINDADELIVENQNILENIDVVIFCIGKLYGKSIIDYSDKEMYGAFEANIIIISKFIKFLIPKLNDKASIIFISSIAASAGSFDEIYSASKSALYGLTKSLAKNSQRGIRYNCISPGLIEYTNMYKSFNEDVINKHLEETPINKLITINELTLILFDICQPHWSSLNGQIININGGRYV
jgi:3-oxoacyl-[acyl-carrier protein] reductase